MTGMRMVMAMRGCGEVEETEVAAAHGGEWCGGSSRSGWDECFWGSPEKFSGGGGGRRRPKGGGRRQERWAENIMGCVYFFTYENEMK
nr:hypothetical protein [Tanacetum cinerariifolium]